jgi:VIT1/CCC1 family predicted Fe2+/Mn2+ transporter
MQSSSFKGVSFGVTSGVITTLGLMIGIDAGTSSSFAVMLAVITIAFADSLSDSLGIHISEESEKNSMKKIWKATFATFISKFFFTMTFIIPLLLFDLNTAMIISIIYGLSLITMISCIIAKKQKENKLSVIIEHVSITILVIIVSYFVGNGLKALA